MQAIDVTTMVDQEQQVTVMDGLTPVFSGARSEARRRYPEAFSDSPGESSAAAAQTPSGSVLEVAHRFACGSAP